MTFLSFERFESCSGFLGDWGRYENFQKKCRITVVSYADDCLQVIMIRSRFGDFAKFLIFIVTVVLTSYFFYLKTGLKIFKKLQTYYRTFILKLSTNQGSTYLLVQKNNVIFNFERSFKNYLQPYLNFCFKHDRTISFHYQILFISRYI